MASNNNVIGEVAINGWCVGCGVCAGVCPKGRLLMTWNKRGEYHPAEVDGAEACGKSCALCLEVCPVHGNTLDATQIGEQLYGGVNGIQYAEETGYFLSSHVGYSKVNGHRENGASGGMATWMLETLLATGEVDSVAAVERTSDPNRLFKFAICRTIDEVRRCSRSVYYPVEASEIIRHVLDHDRTYAIIGLPCVCKAIRKCQSVVPRLAKRIKYVLGIVCGQQKGKFFGEYLCALGKGDPRTLREVMFRVKHPDRPASDFGLRFLCDTGEPRDGVVYWSEGMGLAWADRYFTLNACKFCDDVFAECADAVFMDAWLSEYSRDWRGHTIVLARNPRLERVLNESSGALQLWPLDVQQVIRSQHGVVNGKRKDLRTRLRVARLEPQSFPPVRMKLLRRSFELGRARIAEAQYKINGVSSQAWATSNRNIDTFNKIMAPYRRAVAAAKSEHKRFRIPNAIARRIASVRRRR